ncbi:hypothetical protein [Adhaeribacter terreus]|uniref:STAS/SEC14 domain-containing protein n=1 Tax=Adhaeribacter terreus TaxID=529703 RepID=A0ABW0EEQ1_9BACT
MELEITDLVLLKYDAQTGILYARWPDSSPIMATYFEESLEAVIEAINQYDVKYFLLDSARNRNNLSVGNYLNIFTLLFSGLAQTRLQKMARIKSKYADIEEKYQRYNQEIINGIGVNFKVGNFETRESAAAWLISES